MADLAALKGWVQRTIAEMLLMEVGQAEELASCLLAMPVGSAKQDGEVLQFLRDFLGDTPAVTAFGQEVIGRLKGTKKGPLPGPSPSAAPPPLPQLRPKPQSQPASTSTSSLAKPSSSTTATKLKTNPPPTSSSSSLAAAAEDFWGAPVPAPAARAPSPAPAPASAPAPARAVVPKPEEQKKQQPPTQQPPKQQQGGGGKGKGKGKDKEGGNKPSSLGGSAFGGGGGGGTKKAQPPPPPPGLEAGKGGGGEAGEPAAATPICGCMGAVHKPLGNCLTCGRVACEVEGWQRCAFCKCLLTDPTLGYRSRPPQTLKRDIQAAAAKAAKQPPSHGAYGQRYEDAVALREKLLMFDQTMAERSRVFDDQADYYQNTDWLSQEEKERLEAQEEARREAMDRRRREVAVTFDIAGRRVIVEQDPNDPFATPSTLPSTTTPAFSGFDPAVDVAHGLSEGAARRLGGRGEGEEELPVAASHGAAQLSGRAREVYESLTAHYAKVVAKAQKKKKNAVAAVAGAQEEQEGEEGPVPHSLRLQHEEEAVPDDEADVDVDYLMATA